MGSSHLGSHERTRSTSPWLKVPLHARVACKEVMVLFCITSARMGG